MTLKNEVLSDVLRYILRYVLRYVLRYARICKKTDAPFLIPDLNAERLERLAITGRPFLK